jgi:autophagy-related protein 27
MRPYLSLISVVYLLHIALADDSQCKFKAGSHEFDLSELKGEKSVKREHEEPPSKFVDTLTFDVCDTLKKKDGVADADQVCLLLVLYSAV